MSNRGFGSAFTIRRKVNQFALVFATYLDGLNSLAQSWIDRADVPLTVQNGATTGSDADDGLLMPFGYRGAGAACLNANIGLTSAGVKTIATKARPITKSITGNSSQETTKALVSGKRVRRYAHGTRFDRISKVVPGVENRNNPFVQLAWPVC